MTTLTTSAIQTNTINPTNPTTLTPSLTKKSVQIVELVQFHTLAMSPYTDKY